MKKEEIYEYPLPCVETGINRPAINVRNNSARGFIEIRNSGGGTLKGRITSNTDCITFENEEFEGNNLSIEYNVNTLMYKKGDMIKSSLFISSNGGEKIIPIVINVLEEVIETSSGGCISSIKDFMGFAKKNPIEARKMLGSNDFMLWVKRTGFEHTDILEHIVNDANKERALDNFFVLCGLKAKARIEIVPKEIKHTTKIGEDKIIRDSFAVRKIGWGYADAEISTENECSWLNILENKITSRDFDDNDEFEIRYEIDTREINDRYAWNNIIIKGIRDESIGISVTAVPIVNIGISKRYFSVNDRGYIEINNYSGGNLKFEIETSDNFIKFENDKFLVLKYSKIPFEIKVGALLRAQMGITKKPYFECEIKIKTETFEKMYIERKKIMVANSFIEEISY